MDKIIATLALMFGLQPTAHSQSDILLTPENTVVFRSEVNGSSVTAAQVELSRLNQLRGSKNYPTYLVLDCPGGSIFAGDAFIQYAKTVPNLKTVTIFAASMCASFVQLLPGERIFAQNGVMMFHRAYAGMEGYLNDGELEEQLRFIKGVVLNMEIAISDRLQMSYHDYKTRIVSEWWMHGTEIGANRAGDRRVDIKCTQSLIDKKELVEVQGLFDSFELEFSGCPLFRAPLPQKESKK
jgi:ATP-dependent protease ClpP protease subunit